ncbi:wnt inhibitory factor 1 isoform X2 [Bactrocera tryoni]|uniref:wnt inhibitory factor 1 isoform X1 n=1 Tax=Bactrocera tryoni TaxID=59916 RepID=UPI001A95B0F3|nr:wnt inhibitory factor 1 isoform X1 [Bactrocera tryoni]XP_039953707.1 wnt inhibitory factor 1 isoform X2 [Bactrocera tryoni]XP_039953708.1 wnt inhibitory factor 1 isoform X2 [Bactrocera tryoni]
MIGVLIALAVHLEGSSAQLHSISDRGLPRNSYRPNRYEGKASYHCNMSTIFVTLLCVFFAIIPAPLWAASRHPLHSLRSLHWRPSKTPCSDYEMLIINTRYCVSRCPIRCSNGSCFEDGVCPCADNYQTSFEKEELVCATECLPGCHTAGGFCAAPDLCLCSQEGYYFDAVARRCRKYHSLSDRCFGRCLYGKCNANGECVCAQGYISQENLFGQMCAPVCKQNCGKYGFCFLPNMCACRKKDYHYEYDGECHADYIHLEQ